MSGHASPCSRDQRLERRTMPPRLRLHDFGSGHAAVLPDALIVILFGARDGAAQTLGFARHWRPTVPQAAFVGIELDAAAPRTGLAARQPRPPGPIRSTRRRSSSSAPARPAALPS